MFTITGLTPIKTIPGLIKSFFNKDNNKDDFLIKKELMEITHEEVLQLELLKRKDYEYLYYEEAFNEWGKDAIARSIKNFQRLIKITNKKNIKLTILYAKEPVLILKEPNQKNLNYLLQEFKSLETDNVKFYYINEYDNIFSNKFDAYKKLFFIGDIHWNKEGNKLVAEEILKKITF